MPAEAKKLKRKAERKMQLLHQPPFDMPFLVIVLTLVMFGLVMLFSASYATAYYRFKGDSFHFIGQQFAFAVLGICVMLGVSFFDYHILHKFALPIMGVTILLLIIVLFMPELNHAKRWIFTPVGTFQPSEVAKFAVIVLFAQIIAMNNERMKSFTYGVLPFLVILSGLALLMLAEPHVSGTVLLLGIGGLMMFVGGTGLGWFGLAIGGFGGAIGTALLLFPSLKDRIMGRVEHWLNPWLDPLGDGHQTIQSLYAIGSGGLTGLGIGNSKQKHLYLPEPQNDFIFAVICEELGFIGALIVIGLFIALLLRGIYIACHAKDKFGAMLVAGITIQVTLQAVFNIAVVTNTIPNTGISLPFFSYGGTSLLMLLGEMGFVLSVSRQSSIEK